MRHRELDRMCRRVPGNNVDASQMKDTIPTWIILNPMAPRQKQIITGADLKPFTIYHNPAAT
jgi:hypothetical protein